MKMNQSQSGFTIIETLVAITILMVAIAGPLTVANKALTAAVYARDQMIASYLAQDAMEYIKNVRTNNKLAGQPWLTGFSGVCSSSVTFCKVETAPGATTQVSPDNNPGGSGPSGDLLYLAATSYSSGNLLYGHNVGGIPTQFHRYFNVVPSTTNSSEAQVVVTVSWQTGTIPNSVILNNTIYDVYQ